MTAARALRILLPIAFGILVIAAWEWAVGYFGVSHLVLPAPSAIGTALTDNFSSLMESLWTTLSLTLLAFASAIISGVLLAILFAQSRTIEMTLYPYAVVIQVTPIFAIAPLIVIWTGYEHIDRALLILAWVAAFFPILANTTAGFAQRRSQPRRSVPPLRRLALAISHAAAAAVGTAAHSFGHEDFRRVGADRHHHRRVRGRRGPRPRASAGAFWNRGTAWKSPNSSRR